MRSKPIVAGVLLVSTSLLLAQSGGGPYVMRNDVVASGVRSGSGSYDLVATVTQPAAARQSGGGYVLTGGFHGPRGVDPHAVFCDGFEATPSCP